MYLSLKLVFFVLVRRVIDSRRPDNFECLFHLKDLLNRFASFVSPRRTWCCFYLLYFFGFIQSLKILPMQGHKFSFENSKTQQSGTRREDGPSPSGPSSVIMNGEKILIVIKKYIMC